MMENPLKKYTTKEAIQAYIQQLEAKLEKQRNQLKEVTAVIYHVGDDKASEIYLRNKVALAAKFDINVQVLNFPTKTSIRTFTDLVHLNQTFGARVPQMVQFPVPWKSFDINSLGLAERDIDGLSVGSIVKPCTPQGIMDYIRWVYYQAGWDLTSRDMTIINRSDIVGNPLYKMALDANLNVTQLHSKTSEDSLCEHLYISDIVVTAAGVPNLINEDVASNISGNTLVIDVGINRTEQGLQGDCDPKLVQDEFRAITPVPGGVGLMTTRFFIKNIMDIAQHFQNQRK